MDKWVELKKFILKELAYAKKQETSPYQDEVMGHWYSGQVEMAEDILVEMKSWESAE